MVFSFMFNTHDMHVKPKLRICTGVTEDHYKLTTYEFIWMGLFVGGGVFKKLTSYEVVDIKQD